MSFRIFDSKKKKKEEEEEEGEEEREEEETKESDNGEKNKKEIDLKKQRDLFEILSNSLPIARKADWGAEEFHQYRFKDFTPTERKMILENVKKRYNPPNRAYLEKKDLNNLEKWRVCIKDQIEQISGVVANELYRRKRRLEEENFEFNLSKEDRKYRFLKRDLETIEVLFDRHETTNFSYQSLMKWEKGNSEKDEDKARKKQEEKKKSLQKAKQLRSMAERRKQEQELELQRNRKERENLPFCDEKKRIKFFVRMYGPLKGKQQYEEWEEAHQLEKVTGTLKNELESKFKDLDHLKIDDDDDDDILNESLF